RLDDLKDAGWTVGAWERTPDGGARLRISKRFQQPSQVAGILAELSGPAGPLRDMRFRRTRSAFSTAYSARGALDPAAAGTGIQSDQELTAALAAQHVDVSALDKSLLDQLRKALTVRMTVRLPGEQAHTVVAEPGKRAALSVTSQVSDTRRIALSA